MLETKQRPLSELTNRELWKLFPIILEEHSGKWKKEYNRELGEIVKVVGGTNIVRINHIGSTAVPNLLAKPTVDILMEISRDCDITLLALNLKRDGWLIDTCETRPAPYMMAKKGYSPTGFLGQAFHLHIRYSGDWDEMYFRDYLIAHPDVAEQYGMLKRRLGLAFKHNRDAYTSAKTEFVMQYTKMARDELGNKYKPQE